MIIDNESCANIASTILVRKLKSEHYSTWKALYTSMVEWL